MMTHSLPSAPPSAVQVQMCPACAYIPPQEDIVPGDLPAESAAAEINDSSSAECSPADCSQASPKVRTIDVFSGIGGVTRALHDFCRPVLYCDFERYCQQVLFERMKDGSIPSAPIHGDIKTLRLATDDSDSANSASPEMICGGFPCPDISSIGLQRGISTDTRSGLFLEIMRLVDENPGIKVVFLENVSNIVRCGLREVVDHLCRRGFSFAWTFRSASSMGAPHVRARWFCLAVRDNDFDVGARFPVDEMAVAVDDPAAWWRNEPQRRYTLKPSSGVEDPSYDDNWSLRCQTLGNTVCPMAVRSAFVELVRLMRNRRVIADIFRDMNSIDVDRLIYPFPENGLVIDNRFYAVPSNASSVTNSTEDEDREDAVKITIKMPDGKILTPVHYPTPRRGITHGSSLTDRSTRDLPSMLLHCEETLNAMASELPSGERPEKPQTIAIQNVNYVEWLMGYPADWTRVNHYERRPGSRSSRVASAAYTSTTSAAAEEDDDDIVDGGGDDDGGEGTESDLRASSSRRTTRGGRGSRGGGRGGGKRRIREGLDGNDVRYKPNGMVLFMRENPGLDVRAISRMWRDLGDERRQGYSQRARDAVDGYYN